MIVKKSPTTGKTYHCMTIEEWRKRMKPIMWPDRINRGPPAHRYWNSSYCSRYGSGGIVWIWIMSQKEYDALI